MANDEIDVNDLDSIDALLDEAEVESTKDTAEPTPIAAEEPDLDSADGAEVEEPLEAESLLDDLEADLQEDASLPEEPIETAEASPTVSMQEPKVEEPKVEEPKLDDPKLEKQEEPEDFLQKRAVAAKAASKTNELTVAEMDAIKKLIIIFSSIIITFVLIGIGIGVWAALSASSGPDKKTIEMLKMIKEGTEENTLKQTASSKNLQLLGKKLDALSFQLEQINSDIASLNSKPMPVAEAKPVINLNKMTEQHKPEPAIKTAPTPVPSAITSKPDLAVTHKLTKVSAQLVSTQRRINEVNKRVKNLQYQYSRLLKTIKQVERQVIEQTILSKKQALAEKNILKKEAPKKSAKQASDQYLNKAYHYQSPESRYAW